MQKNNKVVGNQLPEPRIPVEIAIKPHALDLIWADSNKQPITRVELYRGKFCRVPEGAAFAGIQIEGPWKAPSHAMYGSYELRVLSEEDLLNPPEGARVLIMN